MTRFNTAAILAASLLLAVSGTGCVTWPNGIEPVQPKYGQYVNENPLVLEWLPAETSIVLAESGCIPPSCSTLIRYHLAIFDSDSKNVYEVKNLVTTSHNVPNSLGAGVYNWQVRSLYYQNGKWITGDWNKRGYVYFIPGVWIGWGTQPYTFNIKAPAQ